MSGQAPQVDKDRADLTIDPQGESVVTETVSTFLDTLKPESLTIYSTYRLEHADRGIAAEE